MPTNNKSSLSSRERVRLALEHRETDRIPIAMICSGINHPASQAVNAYLKSQRGITLAEYLDPLLDIARLTPPYIGPALAPNEDIWGVRREPISYGSASYNEISYYPLTDAETLADLDHHAWPTPDMFDYSELPKHITAAHASGERCILVGGGNILETAWYMRGFERMLTDFALNPELAWGIMERVTDFYVEYAARMLAAGKHEIDLFFTADDIAGQEGLLMSLGMWEQLVKPHHVRLNTVIHEFDAKVIYHSDGSVMEAVGGLVDMGIDVLQALQFSAKDMDPAALKTNYGERLCFQGGASVQTTLPFGTPEQVQREVEELITILGTNGGYIFGPSHTIQAGTPPENIVAAFDTAANFYPF